MVLFVDCVLMLQLVDVAGFNVFIVILMLFCDPLRVSPQQTPLRFIEMGTKFIEKISTVYQLSHPCINVQPSL